MAAPQSRQTYLAAMPSWQEKVGGVAELAIYPSCPRQAEVAGPLMGHGGLFPRSGASEKRT